MPGRRHPDHPDARVDVTVRPIAKRPLCETREDVQWFLARLGVRCHPAARTRKELFGHGNPALAGAVML